MDTLWIGGVLGLLLGWSIQRTGLGDDHAVAAALRLRRPELGRVLFCTLGFGMIYVAVLGYLAVLDVDHLEIVPLGAGVLVGSLLMGAGLGIGGFTPGTLLAAVGGGRFLPALCALVGGLAGALVCRLLPGLTEQVNGWFAPVEGTLFRTTLHAPYLLGGSFFLHGVLGIVVLGIGLCFLRPVRRDTPSEEAEPTPEEVAAETVVVSLPQEETLLVDTQPQEEPMEEPMEEETPQEAATEDAPEETAVGQEGDVEEEAEPEAERASQVLGDRSPLAAEAMPAETPIPLIRPAQEEEEDPEKNLPRD